MILTADIGTTNLKTGVVDSNGRLEAFVSVRIATEGVSIDPSVWVRAFIDSLKQLEISRYSIDCIMISGNGPTLAPSDRGQALLWTHCAPQQSLFIKRQTGIEIAPTMFLPKLLFIKDNMPQLYNSNRFFMSSPEYLSFFLTGKAATVMPLEGLEKWYWNDEILKVLDIDTSKLPPFAKTGSLLGGVSSSASEVCLIKQGTPVLCGCPDFVAAIVGSGAMHPGQVCDRSGTGDGLNYCSTSFDPKPVYMSYRHPNGRDWNISYVVPDTGTLIDREKGPNMSYSDFFKSQQGHALCMGICHRLKTALDEICPQKPSVMRIIGGPSKSDSFNQMRSDIIGIPVETVESPQAGLSGLGIMAISYLTGTDIAANTSKMVQVKSTFLPH